MTTTQMAFTVETLRAAHAAAPIAVPITDTNGRKTYRGAYVGMAAAAATRQPTARQREFLTDLFAQRAGNPEAERIKAEVNAIMAAGGLTFEVVSATITDLKALPRTDRTPSTPAAPKAASVRGGAWTEVPDGRYAVESATGNNDLDFFLVTTEDEEGDWFGFRRVERVLGGQDAKAVGSETRRAALKAIAAATYERPMMTFEGQEYGGGTYAGPEAAAVRYADEIGECGKCGRSLTRIESRQAGIGPVCATKGS